MFLNCAVRSDVEYVAEYVGYLNYKLSVEYVAEYVGYLNYKVSSYIEYVAEYVGT